MPSNSGSSTPRRPPAAEPARPLATAELSPLFASLTFARRIALAVSGGPDSLALLDCIDRWRRAATDAPEVFVYSVDHRLRAGSRREAADVVAVAQARGMEGRVLTWRGEKPDSDIENAARRARYRLLLDACRRDRATHLLLAHHRDDVAETFLLRLGRGAGVFGLAAMRASIDLGDVTIVRPFLAVPRSRLAATVATAGLSPAHDPMNEDPRFDRVRVRRAMPLLEAGGLSAEEIAASASRLADAADAIDASASALFTDACTVDRFGVATLDFGRFLDASPSVQRRAVVRLIQAIGGADYPPRAERLDRLLAEIAAKSTPSRFRRTLGGVVVESRSQGIVFSREIGRSGLPELVLEGGLRATWDHRYSVCVTAGAPSGYRLGPLGESGRVALALKAPGEALSVFRGLPALRRRGRVVAVHGIENHGFPAWLDVRPIVAARLARPPLFPDFA